MRVLPIVEGAGDVIAVPLLIRRLLQERHGRYDVTILQPYRYGNLPKISRDVRRLISVAAKEGAPILWTVDCDDGCAVEWVAKLQADVPVGLGVPVRFALLVREYESIFLAERTCLTKLDVKPESFDKIPANVESVRDAKGMISRLMPPGRAYKEMTDQPRLTGSFDLAAAAPNSRCLRHLEKALLTLINDDEC